MSATLQNRAGTLRGNLMGGLTTAVVSLPMALAFGVASGAGPQAGLYGAVMVGFWAALAGSSRTLISEPTGPMTLMIATVMTGLAANHPDHALAIGFTVVMVAGLFQMLFGALKLGRYITLMPYSVISGFMSGIGVLLMILQIAPLLGHPVPPGGATAIVAALPDMVDAARVPELLLGAIALVILFGFPSSWRRLVPAQLAVLVFGTIYASIFFSQAGLRVIGPIPMGLPSLHLPFITPDLVGQILVDGLLLAMLGSIDTVLTAMIADSLTRDRHDTDRELVGQGLANLFSGLFGGLPGAGATMGTVVNIQTGATTRAAGIVRALALFGVVLAAAPLLENVPLVVLAAITFKVGLDILDWSFLRRAHRVSIPATLIMYSVLAITVFVDIMVAVGIGVFIANLITIDRLTRLQCTNVKTLHATSSDPYVLPAAERSLLDAAGDRIVLLHLSGPMIFGVAKSISLEQAAMQEAHVVIIDVTEVPMLSVTVGVALENVIRDAESHACIVMLAGANERIQETLKALDITGPDSKTLIAATRMDALKSAHDLIGLAASNHGGHDHA